MRVVICMVLGWLVVSLAACRQNQPQPVQPTSTPGSVALAATPAPSLPPGGGQATAPRPTPSNTPTPIPPTATPTPDRTREAEARIVTLDYGLDADPKTLDPIRVLPTDEAALNVVGSLWLRLTRLDPATGAPQPWLAREWSVEGITVTLRLRDDIPWVRYNPTTRSVEAARDGQGQPRRVQASDVVYSIRRALDSKTGADTAFLLYVIQGGREYHTRPDTPFDRVGVRALDATTVQIKTTTPSAYVPTLLALALVTPLPEWGVEAGGPAWAEPANLVTSGPYALAEWTRGKQLTLVRNPLYPDRDKVQIERLRFPIVADPVQAYTLFVNGNLDTVSVPEGERAAAQADTAKGRRLEIAPTGCTTFVGFTPDKLPLDRVGVRKALAAAIDRQALFERILKTGLPTTHLAPPGVFGAVGPPLAANGGTPQPDNTGLGYDPEAAKRFLAEAGFAGGRGFPPLTYAYNTCDTPACKTNQAIAEALQAMWQSTLGIQVKLESLEWPAYLQRINRRTPVEQMPHAWRMAWCQDYPDQHNWLYDAFYVNAPGSYSRGRPGRFDELVAQAASEQEPGRRVELYTEAERLLLVDEARVAPLYTGATVWASQPWLTRQYPIHAGQDFDQWRLDWEAKRKALGK